MSKAKRITIVFGLCACCIAFFASCATTAIENRLEEMGIKNATVKRTANGTTINLENIQFTEESAVLRESEKEKLKQIGEILTMFEDNDLLITGHTALFGTAKGRKALSEERAKAVAEYLIELDVISRDRIKVKGVGADHPIGSNKTEAGKAKNRRVEITILDIEEEEEEKVALPDDDEEETEE
ncbi:OmpA family protein [Treponema lecithinolyticum]|uniref:OmpA family protein n=1 Tax=Treponema lecithinolyticum TaxID=53418 RepID=UPI0028EB20F5|nr:OmpA family protein [Treponema lecithinolyticum]